MSLDVLSTYSFMQSFSRQKEDNIQRAGESYSLPRFSAVILSCLLHGSVFAAAFFAIGDFGKSEVTLPEVQEVIEVEIVEDVTKEKEKIQTISSAPKAVKKMVSEQATPSAVAKVKPQAGQKASVSRGSFSRERYIPKLTRHIASHKRYPKVARQRRMEGKVVVSFSLDGKGNLRDARIVQSSRKHVLDNAALSTLRRSQPFPLPKAGAKQKEMSFKIPINYSLK